MNNIRNLALKILIAVIVKKHTLNSQLEQLLPTISKITPQDKALLHELCFGVMRYYHQLQSISLALIEKPLRTKDKDIEIIILLGLYQIIYLRIPNHAAVNETVALSKSRKKLWAKALVNAVLRRFLREQAQIQQKLSQQANYVYSHPDWLITEIQQNWPVQWQAILSTNNQIPSLCLRINQQKISTTDYQNELSQQNITATLVPECQSALILKHMSDIVSLPGYQQGWFAVQDLSGQFAVELLQLQADLTVLDACAAPGSKTTHIWDKQAGLAKLLALDVSEERCVRLQQNLQRQQCQADVLQASALEPEKWSNGQLWDRILLDVPCSATGIIRRHPEIKYLRTFEDISVLIQQQQLLLQSLWPLLKPNGLLLYSTCSILVQENDKQIEKFLQSQHNVKLILPKPVWQNYSQYGWQILPDVNRDGFYYACLQKTS